MKTQEIISKHIGSNSTVLDIGARDGSSTLFLKDRGCKVKACDTHPQSEHVQHGALGDDLGQHDLVVARLLLHLVPTDIDDTLQTLWSYVARGGFLYFTNFDQQDIWYQESADEWLADKQVVEHKLSQWTGKKYDGSTKEWFVHEYLVKKG